MRLDKAISSQGTWSRSDVRKLVRAGRVSVDGAVCKDPGTAVDPAVQRIDVDGVALQYKEHIYLVLNKPKGYISATEDRTQKTVLDLVPPELFRPGLFPAGRLDADTTGFVLLTDDGEFAHRILSPRSHIYKTYLATLERPLSEEAAEQLRGGMTLADGTVCLPAEVRILPGTQAEVRICEGRYHEVKRMFAAAGNRVRDLHRTKMGGLALPDDLAEGDCRELLADELNLVLMSSEF